MNHEYQTSIGRVADTGTAMGNGVFALRDIAEGEVVEVAPVILLKETFRRLAQPLRERVFGWKRLGGDDDVEALALGYGGIYNHANPANLRYTTCNGGSAIGFIAARSIAEGEQLTINYDGIAGAATSTDDRWFEEQGITPVLLERQQADA